MSVDKLVIFYDKHEVRFERRLRTAGYFVFNENGRLGFSTSIVPNEHRRSGSLLFAYIPSPFVHDIFRFNHFTNPSK